MILRILILPPEVVRISRRVIGGRYACLPK
jgi:hypothetical protein